MTSGFHLLVKKVLIVTAVVVLSVHGVLGQALPSVKWYSTEKQLKSTGLKPEVDEQGNWFVNRKAFGVDLRFRYAFEDDMLIGIFGFVSEEKEVAYEALRKQLVEQYGKPFGYPYKKDRGNSWLIWKLQDRWLILTHPVLINLTLLNSFPLDTNDDEVVSFVNEQKE